jgi:hypothetical protein
VDGGEAFGLVDGINADLRALGIDCSLLVAIFVLAVFLDIFGLEERGQLMFIYKIVRYLKTYSSPVQNSVLLALPLRICLDLLLFFLGSKSDFSSNLFSFLCMT